MKTRKEIVNEILSYSKSLRVHSSTDISKKVRTVCRQQENTSIGGIFYNVNIN